MTDRAGNHEKVLMMDGTVKCRRRPREPDERIADALEELVELFKERLTERWECHDTSQLASLMERLEEKRKERKHD